MLSKQVQRGVDLKIELPKADPFTKHTPTVED